MKSRTFVLTAAVSASLFAVPPALHAQQPAAPPAKPKAAEPAKPAAATPAAKPAAAPATPAAPAAAPAAAADPNALKSRQSTLYGLLVMDLGEGKLAGQAQQMNCTASQRGA